MVDNNTLLAKNSLRLLSGPVVTGREVMEFLEKDPGKTVGMLDDIMKEQFVGRITNRDDEIGYLRNKTE
ncbi:MAG: hypothetical protein ABIH89_00650 [Elusimicrobiota bacterium]